ncbi:MAG: hypothetical protein ACRELB_03775, partial [Polyangiaceae bacterium]
MKRLTLVAAALALAGCGNLLGIEVLSYDAGDDGGHPGDATSGDGASTADGPGGDVARSDGPGADGPDGSVNDGTTGDTKTDVSPGEAGAETGGPESGLPEGGCTAGSSGCDGNTPWSCVGGQPTDGTPCSNQTCVAGTCQGVCAPGQTQCTLSNTAFQTCQGDGSWGTTTTCTGPVNGTPTCDPASGCGAGACTDGNYPDLCGTTCVNSASDPYNCGVCGQTCTGTTCSGGYCAVQAMCDGTGDGSVVNASNATRLGFQMGLTSGLKQVLYGYFGVEGSVYDCMLPVTAPSPIPAPGVELARVAGICSSYYEDVASDKSVAYVFDALGGDCHGDALYLVQSATNVGGATYGTLIADTATAGGLYTLSTPTLELVTISTDPDSGTTSSASTACVTVAGTLGDGAAGGGHVVAVDTAGGVIRGATASGGSCTGAANLASGIASENAIAVSASGSTFAFENGANLYVCPTTGCTASQLSTAYASGLGTIARNGLVFDSASPPNLYWIGSAGLERCSAVAPGGSCTPT